VSAILDLSVCALWLLRAALETPRPLMNQS
jgi:hypothetical protein